MSEGRRVAEGGGAQAAPQRANPPHKLVRHICQAVSCASDSIIHVSRHGACCRVEVTASAIFGESTWHLRVLHVESAERES
eukprot:3764582-Alexandrium_andersonii.AAC.1